jgi:hypothetical protein
MSLIGKDFSEEDYSVSLDKFLPRDALRELDEKLYQIKELTTPVSMRFPIDSAIRILDEQYRLRRLMEDGSRTIREMDNASPAMKLAEMSSDRVLRLLDAERPSRYIFDLLHEPSVFPPSFPPLLPLKRGPSTQEIIEDLKRRVKQFEDKLNPPPPPPRSDDGEGHGQYL